MQLAKYFKTGPGSHCGREEDFPCCATEKKNNFSSNSLPLALADENEMVKIIAFQSGGRMQERLLSMGLSPGDEIEIIRKQHGGTILIAKAGNRYALGGGMALKIQVSRKKDGKNIG